MKKTVLAVLVGIIFVCSNIGVLASPAGASLEKVGVILYMIDAKDQPLADATVLMQEDLDSDDAFEDQTDRLGMIMIPSFPLTGFIMAVRDADDALCGLADVTLYPGSETRIMNNPRSDDDTITLAELQNTTLSEHINGSAPLEIAGGADSIPIYRYEVQVSEEAGGLGALFKAAEGNELVLAGVSDGRPGAAIPEPTLPPDDELPTVAPTGSSTPGPSPEPTRTTEPSGTASQTADPGETQEPTQTAEPTETSGSVSPSPSPSASEASPSPSASGASPSPSEQTPTGEPSPTPTPILPSPSPTAAPTTQTNLINMKLFLKDTEGKALPYYKTVLNGSVEATTNGEGEAYYTNVATNVAHQLAVYNAEGAEMGTCAIEFVPGNSTSLASVNTGGTYRIDYQEGTQDVYVELTVGSDATAVESASRAPITSGTSSGGSSSGGGSSNSTPRPTEDVIGTPNTTENTPAGPSLRGYFSNDAGVAIPGVTVRLRNEDTKALSSAITTADGTFVISQLPPGNYSLGALNPQGANLGEVNFTAARGAKTQLKESGGKLYLSEAQDSDTVYMDVRELSDGTLGIMYAAKSPMVAPVVPATPEPALSVAPVLEEEMDTTIVETPEPSPNNSTATVVIAVAIGAGAAALIYLLTRRTRIR